MRSRQWSRVLAYGWFVVLGVALLGPALAPGFVLSYDLVFTPRQDLLATSLGLGGGLPRAVPQDAVVALVEVLIPGMLVEKVALLAIPVLAGWGMLRLLPRLGAGIVAGTLAVVNPFVVERLVIGHWGLLLAYAITPWALRAATQLRATGDPWVGVRLVVLIAAAGLTPSGSLLVTTVALPVALLPGSAVTSARRLLLMLAAIATWLPWVLPSLVHGADGSTDATGASVFALRAEGPWGPIITALGGGGLWNAEAVPASRETPLAIAATALVVGLAIAGWPRLRGWLGTGAMAWWTGIAVVGFLAAISSALLAAVWSGALEVVPGGGLLRDAHKLLAPLVLLLAASAGAGAWRVAGLARDRATRVALVAAVAIVPLALLPDAFLGAGGRLSAVDYPGDWGHARAAIEADPRPGDVASFPWTAFRRFAWNDDRTVLDPAPRWMPRTTVVSDDLVVQTPSGPRVVPGDDPRAAAIASALASGTPLGPVLLEQGVGWALVARDVGVSGAALPTLPGWELVLRGQGLDLYAAPGGVRPVGVDPWEAGTVIAVDIAVLVGLVLAVGALGMRRVRVRRRSRLVR